MLHFSTNSFVHFGKDLPEVFSEVAKAKKPIERFKNNRWLYPDPGTNRLWDAHQSPRVVADLFRPRQKALSAFKTNVTLADLEQVDLENKFKVKELKLLLRQMPLEKLRQFWETIFLTPKKIGIFNDSIDITQQFAEYFSQSKRIKSEGSTTYQRLPKTRLLRLAYSAPFEYGSMFYTSTKVYDYYRNQFQFVKKLKKKIL